MNPLKLSFFLLLITQPWALASTHSAESALTTVDTRSSQGPLFDALPEPEGEIAELGMKNLTRDADSGKAAVVMEAPQAGAKLNISKSSDLGNWTNLGDVTTQSRRTLFTDDDAWTSSAYYRCVQATPFPPGTIGFIDAVCNASTPTASGTDSDNYFLRQNDDHEDLEIHYKLQTHLNVTDVRFRFYIGNTDDLLQFDGKNYLPGQKIGDDFATGEHLMINWTAPYHTSASHPDFYRVQMRVFINGEMEPSYESPVSDADEHEENHTANGWQCRPDCLAVYDPVRRHMPLLHFGTATGGTEYPIHPETFLELCDLFLKNGDGTETLVPLAPTPAVLLNPAYNTPNHFLDVVDSPNNQSCGTNPNIHDGGGYNTTPPAVVMFTTRMNSAGDVLFLQYWMYYDFSNSSFNAACNPYHEGDVEYLQVAVRVQNDEKAKWMRPFAATASQHYYGQTLAWDIADGSLPGSPQDIEHIAHDGTGRPRVYVARGTHASYFAPGDYQTTTPGNPTGVPFLPTRDHEVQWNNPSGNTNEETGGTMGFYDLIPAPAFFLEWQGRWGWLDQAPEAEFSATARNGPHGPALRSARSVDGTSVFLWTQPARFHNQSLHSDDVADLTISE